MSQHNAILDLLRQFANDLAQQRAQSLCTELYDANRFNPLRFLKTDEIGISAILAFLLDPKETHGQRDLFLNSFLKAIGHSDFLAYDSVEVASEKMLKNSNRRHDIWLSGSLKGQTKWVISIENKLCGAADQENQLADYWQDLQNYPAESCHVVYLPVWEEDPSEHSISETQWQTLLAQQQASVLSAERIIEWVDTTPIVAPTMRDFATYFHRFLKEKIMGQNQETNELVKEIAENNQLLGSALTLIQQQNEIYGYLIDKLTAQLAEKCTNAYPKLVNLGWKADSWRTVYDRYAGIGFFNPENDGIGVGFESDSKGFQYIYYGIWCHQDTIAEESYQTLSQHFAEIAQKENTKRSKNWLGWRVYPENRLKNWTPETWQGVNTGKLAKDIFESWKPFLDGINSYFEQGLTVKLKK